MKILYIECNMGAAGDMLMSALLELHPDPDGFIETMNHWGIPHVQITRESTTKCGIAGTHVSVRVGGKEEESHDVDLSHVYDQNNNLDNNQDQKQDTHSHDLYQHTNINTQMKMIEHILHNLPVSVRVKADALAVYNILARAEAQVHGQDMQEIHFHEVGTMDAVADIVGVCALMEAISPNTIVVSPIHVGSGQVRCSHGILPVPTPATATILRDVPTYGGQIQGELCTPTGAALLKYFAHSFGDRPLMTTQAIGYGMGNKDFPVANMVRVFLGQSFALEDSSVPVEADHAVVEIACNLDDMTGEEIGFAFETLLGQGALDVYITPIQMKKNRPGQILSCLCKEEDKEKMAGLMLRHTSTFGVRVSHWHRHTLQRTLTTMDTKYGPVRVKKGAGYGLEKSKPEYEDLAKLARDHNLTLEEMKREIDRKDDDE